MKTELHIRMKNYWLRKCYVVVAILMMGTVLSARAQNIITNGSFEFGMGTDIDNWTLIPTAAGRTAADYPSTTGTSPYGPRFLSFNFDGGTPGGSATQDFGMLDGTTTYQLSFAYGAIGTTGTQTLQVTINTTSAPLPAQMYTVTMPSLDLGTVWQRATFTFVGMLNQVPSGVTFADLSTGTLIGDSDLVVDDVSLVAVVPEPGSLFLFAGGGLALLYFWRRKHASAGGRKTGSCL